MAAVKCLRCKAVVTVVLLAEEVQVSHGADFRAKCKKIRNTHAADFVSKATECLAMQDAIDRAILRIR